MFIERGLYFIGNEVLLIYKKFDNPKMNIEEVKEMLSHNTDLYMVIPNVNPEINTIQRYLQSVYEFLCGMNQQRDKSIEPTPSRKIRKNSENNRSTINLMHNNSMSYLKPVKNVPRNVSAGKRAERPTNLSINININTGDITSSNSVSYRPKAIFRIAKNRKTETKLKQFEKLYERSRSKNKPKSKLVKI